MMFLGLYIGLIAVGSTTEDNFNRVKYFDNQNYKVQSQQGQREAKRYDNIKEKYGDFDRHTYERSKEYVLTYKNPNEHIHILNKNSADSKYHCDPKSKELNKICDNDGKYEMDRFNDDNIYNDFLNYDDLSPYNYQDGYYNKDQYINIIGLGNNDTENIVRPCSLDDWECIRKYFSRNSKCKPAYGPMPDPLYLERNFAYFPNFNVTNLRTRLQVLGLSSITIGEFYVNKDTKNLVLALNFQNITQITPKAFIGYQRTAKESIVLADFAVGMFKSGTFTAVIPKIPHLRLDLAEVHADIDDAAPNFIFGPGAFNSTDQDVITAFAEISVARPIVVQEEFLLTSQLYTLIYIQSYLCDFGLKLYSI